jgi:hypothetical protein
METKEGLIDQRSALINEKSLLRQQYYLSDNREDRKQLETKLISVESEIEKLNYIISRCDSKARV